MACKPIVAPLVGAWIEICQYSVCCEELSVAPLVGAWIEIGFRLYLSCSIGVAPLVGAWIEISDVRLRTPASGSRSPRGSVD